MFRLTSKRECNNCNFLSQSLMGEKIATLKMVYLPKTGHELSKFSDPRDILKGGREEIEGE